MGPGDVVKFRSLVFRTNPVKNTRFVIHDQAHRIGGRNGRIDPKPMSIRRKNIAFRYMWVAWLNIVRLLAVVSLGAFMNFLKLQKFYITFFW